MAARIFLDLLLEFLDDFFCIIDDFIGILALGF